MRNFFFYIFYLTLFYGCSQSELADTSNVNEHELDWNKLSAAVFETAKSQNKLVLLHVGAQWCHWCHVMEDSTYSDVSVQNYMKDNFILVKEDQDSRPDLFTKYRSYGWPAIILFDADANEILKLRGYQERKKFLATIQNVRKNPEPLSNEKSNEVTIESNPDSLSTKELMKLFNKKIDFEKGSLIAYNKSLFAPSLEMALAYVSDFDSLNDWLKTSVENSYQLIDPVWGGVYQYATDSDWINAHFERLLRLQAEHIITYCRFGSLFEDSTAVKNAEFIYGYCNTFLSLSPPLFNNSQDADYIKGIESTEYYKLADSERRELGVPITHEVQFTKENAMMVKALTYLWAATENEKYYIRAEKILSVLRAKFKNENGLYQRSKTDSLIFSLDDNIAMLDALIIANQISNQSFFLTEAEELANEILNSFRNENGTLNSVAGDLILKPDVLASSNMTAAFSLYHLASIVTNDKLKKAAENISLNLLKNSSDYSGYFIPFRLLKLKYMSEEPIHAVLIFDESGARRKKKMIQNLIAHGPSNLIIEHVNTEDMNENQKILYGSAEPGTVFICNTSFCSSPIQSPADLRSVLYEQNKKTVLP